LNPELEHGYDTQNPALMVAWEWRLHNFFHEGGR